MWSRARLLWSPQSRSAYIDQTTTMNTSPLGFFVSQPRSSGLPSQPTADPKEVSKNVFDVSQ